MFVGEKRSTFLRFFSFMFLSNSPLDLDLFFLGFLGYKFVEVGKFFSSFLPVSSLKFFFSVLALCALFIHGLCLLGVSIVNFNYEKPC